MADIQAHIPNIISGGFPIASGWEVNASDPFDSRIVVQTKKDLYSVFFVKTPAHDKETTSNGKNKKPAYGGMIVTVADENKAYMLKSVGTPSSWGSSFPNPADPSVEDNWVSVGVNAAEIAQIVKDNVAIVVDKLTDSVATADNVNNIYFVTDGTNGSTYPVGIYTVVKVLKENTENEYIYKVLSFLPDMASDAEVQTINSRLGAVETNVATLSSQVTTNTNSIADNSAAISTLTTNLSALSTKVDNIEADVDALSTDVSALSTTVAEQGTAISGLSDSVSENTNKIGDLDDTLKALSTKVDTNTNDIADLKDADVALSSSIDALSTAVNNLGNTYLAQTSVITTSTIDKLFTATTA